MKKCFLFILLLTAWMATPTWAQELPSCDELAEIADIFDDVSDELDNIGKIKEDSELDQALGDCVTALELLGKVEENKGLTKSVKRLADAWEKMDWEKFDLAIDSVVANLDRIRRADCD